MNEHEPSPDIIAISDKIAEQISSLQKFYRISRKTPPLGVRI